MEGEDGAQQDDQWCVVDSVMEPRVQDSSVEEFWGESGSEERKAAWKRKARESSSGLSDEERAERIRRGKAIVRRKRKIKSEERQMRNVVVEDRGMQEHILRNEELSG